MKQILIILSTLFCLQAKAQVVDTNNHLQYVNITPFKVSYNDTVFTSRLYLSIKGGNGISDTSVGYMDFSYLLMDAHLNQTDMGYIRLSKTEYINFLAAFCSGNKLYVFTLIAGKLGVTIQ